MPLVHQAIQWLHHWLKKESPHSTHAPALFRFYTEVIRKDSLSEKFHPIEHTRLQLCTDQQSVPFKNLGSGKTPLSGTIEIQKVASTSLSPAKWCRLLVRLSKEIQAKNILELGTCLGISTLYLSDNSKANVWTMEGNESLAGIAAQVFKIHQRANIHQTIGNIDDTLESLLRSLPDLDLVFIDANHRFEPTMRYATAILKRLRAGGLLILDDIHRSKEMDQAWSTLRKCNDVNASFDLFKWGILIKEPSDLKGHHIWDYT